MFKSKQWLWRLWQRLMGTDRAYAKYLAQFEYYQQQALDSELHQSMQLTPMTKEAFIAAWQKKTVKPSGKSCGCKTGCCG